MGHQRILYDRSLDGVRVLARCITDNKGDNIYRIEGTLNGEPVRTEVSSTLTPTSAVSLARVIFREMCYVARCV